MAEIEDHVPMKIKYEYFNDKGEQKFSKEFEVNLSLDPDNFEENPITILNTCNFKTREERFFYNMFDLEKEIFITKTDQLKDFKKHKKTIVMKNCTIFSKQIIEQLREEEARYKQGKNIDVDESTNSSGSDITRIDTLSSMDEKKMNKIKLTIFNLKKNYLYVDMFAEEFISYEGIKYLISFLQLTSGNLRTYAIEALNKLLSFESSDDYIRKSNEIIDTLYEILMKSDTINCSLFTMNTLIRIISQGEEKTMYLIDVAENYAKKSVTQIFSQIVSLLLISKDANIKGKTLLFINVLFNFCDSGRLPKLILQFKEAGIYEALEKIAKTKEKDFQENLTNFQIKTGKIISGSEHELKVYRDQVQEMKNKCQEIEQKYENMIEKQLIYENYIKEIMLFQDDIYKQNKICFDHLAPKHRFDKKEDTPQISYDENGIFDFINIIKHDENDSSQKKIILFEKYYNTKVECKKIEKDINDLEIKQKELIEEKVKNLEIQINNSLAKKENLKKENQNLESKLKELEETISKGDFKKDETKESQLSSTPSEQNISNGPIPPPPPPHHPLFLPQVISKF